MITDRDFVQPISFYHDYITDQDMYGINRLQNTSSLDYDVTLGYGCSTNKSVIWGVQIGGFVDMRVTATMQYLGATTSQGSEEIGVIARLLTAHSPNATYYYARIDAQTAKITKVIDGSFTTLTQSAFALPPDTDVTITFEVVGNSLSANFITGTGSLDVDLSTTDSDIDGSTYAGGGSAGCRSSSSTIRCSSILVEEI